MFVPTYSKPTAHALQQVCKVQLQELLRKLRRQTQTSGLVEVSDTVK